MSKRKVCSECGSPDIEYLPYAGDDPYCPECEDYTGAIEEEQDNA